jgi:hypothetical protein
MRVSLPKLGAACSMLYARASILDKGFPRHFDV